MSDIFNFNHTVGKPGFVSPDVAKAAFTFNNSLSLVQQWNVQYQLSVQPIFECGSSKVYFSAKHANGTATVGRIVSSDVERNLGAKFGTVCSPKEARITATEACNGSSQVKLRLVNTVLASIGFSGQAQNAYVAEDVQLTFASLQVV